MYVIISSLQFRSLLLGKTRLYALQFLFQAVLEHKTSRVSVRLVYLEHYVLLFLEVGRQ